jgi:hypothetical protein
MIKENLYFVKHQQQTIKLSLPHSLHWNHDGIHNNLNLSICRVSKFSKLKLKQQVIVILTARIIDVSCYCIF